jgi:hypothetical protein
MVKGRGNSATKFILLLFLASYAGSYAQGVKVRVSTDSLNYLVGDYINLVYEISHTKETVILFPQLKDSLKRLEIVGIKPFTQKEEEESLISTYSFTLAGYDSGNATVPALTIYYKLKNDTTVGSVVSDSINLTIHTFAVDTLDGAKDIRDPKKIPYNWNLILIYLAILILLAALGRYLYKYYKMRKEAGSPELMKIRLPHEIALEELTALEGKKLWQKGFIKQYHTEITEIIRKYFELRFNFPALELTTSEVLGMMDKNSEAKEVADATSDFLSNADMVKFAKYIPMDKINEEMMKQANEIINKTIPAEKPAEEENV